MDEPRSYTRSPMSIHPYGSDYWTKMPTEKLQAMLLAQPDGSDAKTIKTILETRNNSQLAKTILAVSDANRVLTEELQKISARNESISKRLGLVTVTVSLLAAIAVAGAAYILLHK